MHHGQNRGKQNNGKKHVNYTKIRGKCIHSTEIGEEIYKFCGNALHIIGLGRMDAPPVYRLIKLVWFDMFTFLTTKGGRSSSADGLVSSVLKSFSWLRSGETDRDLYIDDTVGLT